MNRKDILTILREIDLPAKEYYILSTGCLVLLGIKDNANDLDLCVSKRALEILRIKYKLEEITPNANGFFKIRDNLEVVIGDKSKWENIEYEGYQLESLEKLLKFKEKRILKKDEEDIKMIKEYLGINKLRK